MARDKLMQLRRGTRSQWYSTNPILAQGEPGFETDSGNIRVGNGTDTFNKLYDNAIAGNSYLGGFYQTFIDFAPLFPSNYVCSNATVQATASFNTSTRIMMLIPFEMPVAFSHIDLSGTVNATLTSFADSFIYNSDRYGRPYQLVTDISTKYTAGLSGTGSTFEMYWDNPTLISPGIYWLGLVISEVTAAGTLVGYAGNDTFVHSTLLSTNSGSTLAGGTAGTSRYNLYYYNLPYMTTTFAYQTSVNTTRAITLANSTTLTTALSLSGAYGVHGGIAIGDSVTLSNVDDPTIYAKGTVTALSTPTTYTITVNFTSASASALAQTASIGRNQLCKTSDFDQHLNTDSLYSIEPIVPSTLVSSGLTPSTGNAPLVVFNV